jgi:hypothetical protein
LQKPNASLPQLQAATLILKTVRERRERLRAELRPALPAPYDRQREIRASSARRKVICTGRRAGKTTLAAIVAIEKAIEGRRILFAAPTDDQITTFWDICKRALAGATDAGRIYKNETRRVLEFPNGARIRGKTAYNAETLRGDYADFLVLEEFAFMDYDAWDQVGAPMLLDNDGDAWFLSTPNRRNHFHRLHARALADTSGRWQAWQMPSHANPYLSTDALAEITADMTEQAYRQEILAEFLEGEGALFRNIAANLTAPPATPDAHRGHHVVCGVDWARQHDYTAVSIGCADCRQELAIDRFNQVEYAFQRQRLAALVERWGVGSLLVEANSIGGPNLEMLQRDGLPAAGFDTTASSKPPLIENLALALEREEWRFLADPVWAAELEAYEQKISPTTGRASYAAPSGLHDDCVIARALMLRAAGSRLEVY